MEKNIVISNITIKGLENIRDLLINRGYIPYGDIIYGDGIFFQSLVIKKVIINRLPPYKRIKRNRRGYE